LEVGAHERFGAGRRGGPDRGALAAGFVGYCLVDLARCPVRYLPEWAWALICVLSIPVGGIIDLLVGRQPR